MAWRTTRRRTRRKILISTQVDAAMGVVSRSVAYRAGFKISDVRVDAVAPVCPILLVHGSEDTFVALKHSQKLQDAFQKTATLRVDEEASTTRGGRTTSWSTARRFIGPLGRRCGGGPRAEGRADADAGPRPAALRVIN